jgi:hypothetical protein
VNLNAECLGDFASYNLLRITDTFFRPKNVQKYTLTAEKKSVLWVMYVNKR